MSERHGQRRWRTSDVLAVIVIVAVGLVLDAVLPSEWSQALTAAGVIAFIVWIVIQSRRRAKVPPSWSPGGPPSNN